MGSGGGQPLAPATLVQPHHTRPLVAVQVRVVRGCPQSLHRGRCEHLQSVALVRWQQSFRLPSDESSWYLFRFVRVSCCPYIPLMYNLTTTFFMSGIGHGCRLLVHGTPTIHTDTFGPWCLQLATQAELSHFITVPPLLCGCGWLLC